MFSLRKFRLIDALIRGYINQDIYNDYIQRGIKNDDLIELPYPVTPQLDYTQIPITGLNQGFNTIITPSLGKKLRIVRLWLWTFKLFEATVENSRITLYMGDRVLTGDLPIEMNPFNVDFLWWPLAGEENEPFRLYLNENVMQVEGFLVYYEI